MPLRAIPVERVGRAPSQGSGCQDRNTSTVTTVVLVPRVLGGSRKLLLHGVLPPPSPPPAAKGCQSTVQVPSTFSARVLPFPSGPAPGRGSFAFPFSSFLAASLLPAAPSPPRGRRAPPSCPPLPAPQARHLRSQHKPFKSHLISKREGLANNTTYIGSRAIWEPDLDVTFSAVTWRRLWMKYFRAIDFCIHQSIPFILPCYFQSRWC